MRDRPFIAAGEQPRLYSDVLVERRQQDPAFRQRAAALEAVHALEGEASEASDPAERKRLLCEAEALRLELDEGCLGCGLPARPIINEVTP